MRGQKYLTIFVFLAILLTPIISVVGNVQGLEADCEIIKNTSPNPINENNDALEAVPQVFISEVQTNGPGSGTTAEEFIELYNEGDQVVNLLGYSIWYVTSSGSESELFTFNEPLLFLPQSFFIGKLAGSGDFLPEIVVDFEYEKGSNGLSASGGGLKLISPDDKLIDEIHWTSGLTSEDSRILALVGGSSAQRYILDEKLVKDEQSDFTKEFIVDTPTPKEFLSMKTEAKVESSTNNNSNQAVVIDNPKIYINELFVDPASPLLDSKDEFIELYNPHNIRLDISGYTIFTGTNNKNSYTFPSGSFIGPLGYAVVKSSGSSLTLVNSGGQAELIDNQGRSIDLIVYGGAEEGVSWAKTNGAWDWTITVTEGTNNVINKPIKKVATAKSSSSKTTSKKSSSKTTKTNFTKAPPIKINEIFPDPASPQKDSEDEFIELYNPHDIDINIADYVITAGASRIYKHTIKSPAIIKSKGYYTVTSADTSLSLPNGGGTVSLINNLDQTIDKVEYPDATVGASWAFIDGKWQWTSSPTKNTANVLLGLAEALNKNKNYKSTSVKSASVPGAEDTPLIEAPQPLPGWALAIIGISTICYAAYEYRFEFRNYLYRFGQYRNFR